MSKWVGRLVVVVMVAAIVFSAVGFAAAQGPGRGTPGRDRGPAMGGFMMQPRPAERVIGQVIDAAADAVGMTSRELIMAVRDSEGTLGAFLSANDVDPQAIVDAVKAEAVEIINAAADEGTISAEQAENAIAELDTLLETVLNSDLRLWDMPLRDQFGERMADRVGDVVDNTLIGVLAEMAGADLQDVVRDALTPPTIAEIAESYGLDADAIIAETEARVTSEVAGRLEDGTLTQAQADAILDGLNERLVERFNSPLGKGLWGDWPGLLDHRPRFGI